ncbi:peroxiredoxin [Chitinibacteraceae bacterium HSL-7]
MLDTGQPAPDFELPSSSMEMVRLSDCLGANHVVLYFFNKDHTPGGVTEAIEFSDRVGDFARCNARVLGVSLDDCLAHEAFRDEEGIEFELLSDEEGDACRAYHVLTQWQAGSVIRYGIERSTFVIDRAGVIRHALYHVSPKGHAAEILSLVQSLE